MCADSEPLFEPIWEGERQCTPFSCRKVTVAQNHWTDLCTPNYHVFFQDLPHCRMTGRAVSRMDYYELSMKVAKGCTGKFRLTNSTTIQRNIDILRWYNIYMIIYITDLKLLRLLPRFVSDHKIDDGHGSLRLRYRLPRGCHGISCQTWPPGKDRAVQV